jgi:CelD/BcsL family acetyltransferase involved in cellulose biosynthesis
MKSIKWTLAAASQNSSSWAKEWDALNDRTGALPFLASDVVLAALTHFGSGREILCVGSSAGETVAMALLTRKNAFTWESFQPSQLPLGAYLQVPEFRVDAAATSLLSALPKPALILGLTQLDPAWLARPQASASVAVLDYIETAWVNISGSFDDYWSARGKNLRQNMRKQRNKLEAEGITPRLEIITTPDSISGAIIDYGRLESAGWKAEIGTAVQLDNAQGRFYREILESACQRGEGLVYRYWFGEKAVAIDLCVQHRDALVILKTTYDENYKAVSPAFLMREESFRKLFEGGSIKRIEFFGKMMEWHTRWTEHSRRLYHLTCYRWSWVRYLKDKLQRAPESAITPSGTSA